MTTEAIKEVLFDWDGTCANTEEISATVTRKVLTDYANSVFGHPMTNVIDGLEMRGKDFGQIAKKFQDAVNAGLPDTARVTLDVEDLRLNKLRPLSATALLEAPLADGIDAAWAELEDDMGLGLAVVSNSPRLRIQPLLEKHEFTNRIPAQRLFSAFEDVAKLKEDPAIYLLAAEKLGITPQQAAAVEDSATGMRAATSAGVGLRVGFTGLAEKHLAPALEQTLLKEGAHIVINDMRDLPQAIRSHQNRRLAP